MCLTRTVFSAKPPQVTAVTVIMAMALERGYWTYLTSDGPRGTDQRRATPAPAVINGHERGIGSGRAAIDRRSDQHGHWRTVADRQRTRPLTGSFTCRFPTILPCLYPSDVHAGECALDLTQKRSKNYRTLRPGSATARNEGEPHCTDEPWACS